MNRSEYELTLERMALQIEPFVAKFYVIDVLRICQRLRHKISVLNRRLQRTRTENKRLRMENQRLIDFYKKYE